MSEAQGETAGRTAEEWVAKTGWRVQQATRRLFTPLMKRCFRPRYFGLENIPDGAAIVCPNHVTWIDGTIYAMPLRRPMRWMGKREALQWPIIGRYLAAGGVFPVARGAGDKTAMHIAEAVLESGQLLTVYMEGTRGRQGLLKPRSGAARLALATGVPVVPMASFGMKKNDYPRGKGAFWRRHVIVMVGEPMRFDKTTPTPENVPPVRDAIWEQVVSLHETARRLHAKALAGSDLDSAGPPLGTPQHDRDEHEQRPEQLQH